MPDGLHPIRFAEHQMGVSSLTRAESGIARTKRLIAIMPPNSARLNRRSTVQILLKHLVKAKLRPYGTGYICAVLGPGARSLESPPEDKNPVS